MGRVTGGLRILSICMILSIIGFVIGCSDSNPVGKTGALSNFDNDTPVTAPPDRGKDDFDFDDDGSLFDEPVSGNRADQEDVEHLYYGLASGMDIFVSSKLIGKQGGYVQIPQKYDPENRRYRLDICSFTLYEDVTVGLEVRAGKNKFDEDLILCYVTPNFEEIRHNLVFSYNDDACDGSQPCAEYNLFYFAGGRWLDYGSVLADKSGLVAVGLPSFGLYAILKNSTPESKDPSDKIL